MDAILLAAGTGSRTKLESPKQLISFCGRPLFIHELDLFKSVSEIEQIIVTVIPDRIDEFRKLCDEFQHENVICVSGGSTRQESVYNALKSCKTDRVLIHAASRPFVTRKYIQNLLSIEKEVVVPCLPLIYSAIDSDFQYIDRSKVLCIQLPQIFNTKILKKAHEMAKGKNYPEDSELVYHELGILPTLVEGLDSNFKITMPFDVKLAELLFNYCRGDTSINFI